MQLLRKANKAGLTGWVKKVNQCLKRLGKEGEPMLQQAE